MIKNDFEKLKREKMRKIFKRHNLELIYSEVSYELLGGMDATDMVYDIKDEDVIVVRYVRCVSANFRNCNYFIVVNKTLYESYSFVKQAVLEETFKFIVEIGESVEIIE